jgi:hypothetical protein
MNKPAALLLLLSTLSRPASAAATDHPMAELQPVSEEQGYGSLGLDRNLSGAPVFLSSSSALVTPE